MALSVSAALVVVLLALHWRRAQRWLTGRTVLWAGAVSFSLYLVHEPIVVASVKALGDRMLWLALPLAVVVALTTAELFRRGVETPAGTLARQIGRGVGSWHPMRRRREAAQVRSMLQDIRSGLRRAAVVRHADPEAPVRSALPVLGVGASAARRIARRAVRTRDVVEPHLVVPAARRLWDDAAAREERYAAMELLALPGVDGDPRVLPAVEHMARTGRWRDYADALARRLPRLLENDADRTGELLRGWSTDDDVWMRRMAITAQVGRGERTDRGLLVDVIAPNRSHPDVFVRTAVGAALRDLARADPDWVRAYVEDHGLDPITRSAAPTPAEVDEPTARGVPSLAVPA
jgi:3-methyladenine DNA glycosylase AlkD